MGKKIRKIKQSFGYSLKYQSMPSKMHYLLVIVFTSNFRNQFILSLNLVGHILFFLIHWAEWKNEEKKLGLESELYLIAVVLRNTIKKKRTGILRCHFFAIVGIIITMFEKAFLCSYCEE